MVKPVAVRSLTISTIIRLRYKSFLWCRCFRHQGHSYFDFPSPRHFSSSGSYPVGLFGMGDPGGSNPNARLALTVTGAHKTFHYGKMEIPLEGHSTRRRLFFTRDFHLNVRMKLVKWHIWSIALYGAKTWKLRKVNEKCVESFEVWRWKRIEKVSLTIVWEMKKCCIQSRRTGMSYVQYKER